MLSVEHRLRKAARLFIAINACFAQNSKFAEHFEKYALLLSGYEIPLASTKKQSRPFGRGCFFCVVANGLSTVCEKPPGFSKQSMRALT